MMVVTLFVKDGDASGEEVIRQLEYIKVKIPHQLAVVSIDSDPVLLAAYQHMVPLVQVGPYRLQFPFSEMDLRATLGAARDRSRHLDQVGDKNYSRRMQRGRQVSAADRISLWLSHRYMLLINLLLFLYVGLPFLAPVLAKNELNTPARVILTIYSPLCHQLTYRSWFLFGMQTFYPRDLAQVSGVATYEQLFNADPTDLNAARRFTGKEPIGYGAGQIGYKVALCQRDVAIYGALLLFGLIFSATGRKIKALPWYFWIAFGLLPIGLDGFSQLPGLLTFLPEWMLIRESNPILRTVTGGLFGVMTAWYLFPMIEESMRDARALLSGKSAVVSQIQNQG
ncbi:MAG: DUF2085 domain-containing protein [Chloroflexota bacterium]